MVTNRIESSNLTLIGDLLFTDHFEPGENTNAKHIIKYSGVLSEKLTFDKISLIGSFDDLNKLYGNGKPN